ncbi:uncharacterized protein LOC124910291 [Impatiens glandulifera]|uniref:uncharacterized protein LOC124910291 n=1 Tax=Impatiens glandulifera TaxID=253017 RepID=UPI001FB100D8|nr:uncharacterized protein LOC124910291 [Impatiens glandulifera]
MASLTPHWPCFCTSISVRGNFPNPRNSGVIVPLKASSSSTESPSPTSSNSPEVSREPEPTKIDPVKIAFAKAKAYKKGVRLQQPPNPSSQTGDIIEVKPSDSKNETIQNTESYDSPDNQSTQVDFENAAASRREQELPASVKLAMERAKKYKANKESVLPVASSNEDGEVVETEEIIMKKIIEKGELKVSKMDFIGLGFSDKRKTRGLPAGLIPIADPFPDRDPGEVEIIVGDRTKFGNATVSEPESIEDDDKSDLYKPKVSTWGVFPRPGNISKTYGGGRTIQPGDSLETDEDRAAKQARTRELLSQYKKRTGIKIDPELKDECEKDLKNGDALMENGMLEDALPFYEKIMEKLAFQNELHGLAALQWSICQDSLGRQSKARVMYEKLQSHPTYSVSKSAKQFLFGFQAMDMMKVRSMDMSKVNAGYQNYFEAFIKDKEIDYSLKDTETDNVDLGLDQVLPYVAFIVSPIFLVFLVALTKAR